MDGNKLINKYGLDGAREPLWVSDDEWNFKITDDYFYIENISKNKVLETSSDLKITLEDFEEDKEGQLWYQETSYAPNARGYFILRDFVFEEVLTPTPEFEFEDGTTINLHLEGNIRLMPKTSISLNLFEISTTVLQFENLI